MIIQRMNLQNRKPSVFEGPSVNSVQAITRVLLYHSGNDLFKRHYYLVLRGFSTGGS